MSPLEKKTLELEINGHHFVLSRPGRGGVRRLHLRLAEVEMFGPAAIELDGEGAEMDAVLFEYLTAAPAHWLQADQAVAPGKPLPLDLDAIDVEEYLAVGEEALNFHRTFRHLDARFGRRHQPAA